MVGGSQGGEGMEQAALKEVRAVVKGAKLLMGLRSGGLQAGGEFVAALFGGLEEGGFALLQALALGFQDLLVLRFEGFQLFGKLGLDGVEFGQVAADLDGAADGEDDIRQVEDG